MKRIFSVLALIIVLVMVNSMPVMAQIYESHSETDGLTIYSDSGFKLNGITVSIEMSEEKGIKMFVLVPYSGDDRIFINALLVRTDKDKYEFSIPSQTVIKDTISSGVIEMGVIFCTNEVIVMLEDLATSNRSRIHIQGSKGSKDEILTEAEKEAIERMLNKYKSLKANK